MHSAFHWRFRGLKWQDQVTRTNRAKRWPSGALTAAAIFIPDAVLDRLFAQTEQTRARVAWFGAGGAPAESFARGTLEATKSIIADTEMFSESNKWMHYDLATVNKFCNGITTTTAEPSPIMARLALAFPTSMISGK